MSGNGTAEFSEELELLDRTIREGDRPVGLLLGAGCSASLRGATGRPLIPTIAGLTEEVSKRLDDETASALAKLKSTLETDGLESATVETWLGRVRMMREVVGASEVRGLSGAQLEALESAMTKSIAEIVAQDLPENGEGYDALGKWASMWDSERVSPLHIFSLNYDLLVEQAFERYSVPFFDGFVGSRYPFLDHRSVESEALPNYWARVWKMHGSVNWEIVDKRVTRSTRPVVSGASLIHPSHLKYEQSRRMPFLLMQDQLKRFLAMPSATLVIAGYSFGDEHVNERVFEGLRANPSATAFALQYQEISAYSKSVTEAARVSNIRFLGPDALAIAGASLTWAATDPDTRSGISPSAIGDFASLGKLFERQADS